MRIVILISLFITLFLDISIKSTITILLSIGWFLYSIYFAFNLRSIKDEKIVTDKCRSTLPNNNKSYCIRYLYNTKVDYKCFMSTILELLLINSISVIKNNNTFYFIDNKIKDEKLNKNESTVKKILFNDMGIDDKVSLENIKNKCSNNSGYINSVYKEWQNIFLYENASLKYFKSIKPIVDNSLFYFMISIIISIFNIFFTNMWVVAIFIFILTTMLIKSVNDYSNREKDANEEYIKWLEFKNYLSFRNDLDKLDVKVLEQYAIYAYILDEYDEFVKILNKKYANDIKCFDDSIILYIMNLRIFDIIESDIKSSLNNAYIKSAVLFSKNKGRV